MGMLDASSPERRRALIVLWALWVGGLVVALAIELRTGLLDLSSPVGIAVLGGPTVVLVAASLSLRRDLEPAPGEAD